MVNAFVAVVSVVLLAGPLAQSYSIGAGGCNGGGPAVGGPHSSSSTSGSLATGFQVTLDSTPLTPGFAANFVVGKDHILTLKVTTASYFKGVLFRLGSTGGVATTSALAVQSGDSTLRLASETCINDGVGGVTHTSNSQKTGASVTLRLNSVASNLPLELTVVVQNSGGISTYYYSGFTVNAVANGATNPSPTQPPAVSTTPRPVSPTIKPVSRTTAPVAPSFRPFSTVPVNPTLQRPHSHSPVARTRQPLVPTRRPTRQPVAPTRRPTPQPVAATSRRTLAS